MPKQYLLSTFLELAPNELLRAYLGSHSLGIELDWPSLPERPCDAILTAIESAPRSLQGRIDSDFQEITRHATPKHIERLIDTGRRTNPPINELCDQLPQVGDRLAQCLWVLINHPKLFEDCLMLEQIEGHRCELRSELPEPIADVDHHSIDAFTVAIGQHFQQTQGCGQNCIVEHLQRDNEHVLFCHVQDHAQTEHEFVDGDHFDLTTRWPAFDVILVYDPEQSTLQTYIPGGRHAAEQIEKVFGQCFLGNDLSTIPKLVSEYDLSCLMSVSHVFEIRASDPIERIVVRELKLAYVDYPDQYVTFSVPKDAADGRVISLASDLTDSEAELQEMFQPVKAKLTATFRRGERGRQRKRTFTITWPSTSDLGIDAMDKQLKALLKRWGIDASGSDDDHLSPA